MGTDFSMNVFDSNHDGFLRELRETTRRYDGLYLFRDTYRRNLREIIQQYSDSKIHFEIFDELDDNLYGNNTGYNPDFIIQTILTIQDILSKHGNKFPREYEFILDEEKTGDNKIKYQNQWWHMYAGYDLCEMVRAEDLQITDYDRKVGTMLHEKRRKQINENKIELMDKIEFVGDEITVKITSISTYERTKEIFNFILDYCKKVQHLNAKIVMSLD